MGRGLNGNRMTLYSLMLDLTLCSYNYMLGLRLVLAIQGSIYAPGDIFANREGTRCSIIKAELDFAL